MTITIIQQRLKQYACASLQEEEQAIREISQEVILAGLSRTNFFKQAQFHGGTCLRVFHGVNRFSEDLDFVLKKINADFSFEPYLKPALREIAAFGFDFEVTDRSKLDNTVKKAFIKDNSIGKLLELDYIKPDRSMKKVRIKLEVDTNPPSGARTVTSYLTFPFPASITVHDVPSLFAGKLHALLCREYVKGRDWYDLIWYLSQKEEVNYMLLKSQLKQTGPWQDKEIDVSKEWCFNQLREKVNTLDWQAARRDVSPFTKDRERSSLELWGVDFFSSMISEYLKKGSYKS